MLEMIFWTSSNLNNVNHKFISRTSGVNIQPDKDLLPIQISGEGRGLGSSARYVHCSKNRQVSTAIQRQYHDSWEEPEGGAREWSGENHKAKLALKEHACTTTQHIHGLS